MPNLPVSKLQHGLRHEQQRGWRHRFASLLGWDRHEQAPLPSRRDPLDRDPFPRDERRRKNRQRERSRAVSRSRGQVLRR